MFRTDPLVTQQVWAGLNSAKLQVRKNKLWAQNICYETELLEICWSVVGVGEGQLKDVNVTQSLFVATRACDDV